MMWMYGCNFGVRINRYVWLFESADGRFRRTSLYGGNRLSICGSARTNSEKMRDRAELKLHELSRKKALIVLAR
jgi:hypothetical protein